MNFSLKRFLSILNSRNKEFYRDKGAVGWTFLFPLLMILGFGYFFEVGTDNLYKVGHLNNPPSSVEFVQWISFSSPEEAIKKLKLHRIHLLVDFDAVPPKYWVNDSSPQSRIAEKIFLQSQNNSSTTFQRSSIKGKTLQYIDWLFPGLLTMNTLWMSLWGVGWIIVRQRVLGVLKRFKASPLTAFEYLLGQMTSRLLVLLMSGIIVFVGGNLLYPFSCEGSYLDLLVIYFFGCTALCSIGLAIAARMTSEELARGILDLVTFPIMFFSEVWFSLEGSPDWVLSIAHTLPLWHMTDGMRSIMLEGATLYDLRYSVLILSLTTLFFVTLGSALFKWNKSSN